MKFYLKSAIIAVFLSAVTCDANAQYYQIANQLTGLIRPALSGSGRYKGYADISYLAGLGNRKVNFVNISTSQGYNYNSWFYMGVGIGLDIALSNTNGNFGSGFEHNNNYWNHSYKTTGFMVPVFTDFRFNIGANSKTAFYCDARIGASFLMGNNYIAVADGFITNREYFYLKPSIGIRVPVSSSGKQAVDIGVAYQLLTANYWYNGSGRSTLNALGATVAFEW